MTEEKARQPSILEEFLRDFPAVWRSIPFKGLFATCLLLWVLLFQFLGNSTFGYVNTHSLFSWTLYSYRNSEDDKHGMLIPFLVLGFLWWKRNDLAAIKSRQWLPGLAFIAAALFLHILGYLTQQTRLSLAAFFFGVYGLIGLVWGPTALRKTFFPLCLFAFALPLNTLAETITFPLRLIATKFTTGFASTVLGINVIRQGTLILDPHGAFKYEVAAACGGLRSLTAVLALCTIYAFMNFKRARNIMIMIAAGFPLAVLGNVTRLVIIIIVSEAFGQKWGEWVHDNSFFSLLPYIPPIVGIILLGHLLREEKKTGTPSKPIEPPLMDPRGRVPAAT